MPGIKAVLFDLDGTLLPLDIDKFLRLYLPDVSAVHAKVPVRAMMKHIMDATNIVVAREDESQTNEEVFAREIAKSTGIDSGELLELFYTYYLLKFPAWREHFPPNPKARQLVDIVKAKGLRMTVATNAIFPLIALEERIRWAGLAPDEFELITAYENMHTCKPHARYYREILGKMGLDASECVMIGNDIEQDIAPAREAGLSTFLLTDFLIGEPEGCEPFGDFDALLAFAQGL